MSSARRPPSPQAAPPGYAVVGTAGHIDHGKSALVRALTGVDPDRLEEEKRRGMTIDLTDLPALEAALAATVAMDAGPRISGPI